MSKAIRIIAVKGANCKVTKKKPTIDQSPTVERGCCVREADKAPGDEISQYKVNTEQRASRSNGLKSGLRVRGPFHRNAGFNRTGCVAVELGPPKPHYGLPGRLLARNVYLSDQG